MRQSRGSYVLQQRKGIRRTSTKAQRKLRYETLEDRQLMSASPAEPALQLFATTPALFVENQGQWADPEIRYLHPGDGVNVAMTDDGVVFQLSRPAAGQESSQDFAGSPPAADDGNLLASRQFSARFEGASPVRPKGEEAAPARFNYLLGESSGWRSDVPAYQKVVYDNLYEGIDLASWGLRSQLKYEFHVAPGADYHQIEVRYDGIDHLALAEDGSLHVNLGPGWGELVDEAPYVYQEVAGTQVPVSSRFVLRGNNAYSFEVTGSYDPALPLVIDPQLAWSMYVDGNFGETASGVAIDGSGNVYFAGWTGSTDFITTPGAYDTSSNGIHDGFVMKLSPGGDSLLYATYFGGSESDTPSAIAVDAEGNAYVVGDTASRDFPVLAGALGPSHHGGLGDGFLLKLNSQGDTLLASTYLGGSSDDKITGIALGSTGDALLSGWTRSSDFPTTPTALDRTLSGSDDAFFARIDSAGTTLRYSTYLGGTSNEFGTGVAVDAQGNAYVIGQTTSSDFPVTADAFSTNYHVNTPASSGTEDAFVLKIDLASGQLAYSTYLGGGGGDVARAISVDQSGDAYVTGDTLSDDFPTTPGAADRSPNGLIDAFVAKLDPSGGSLLYSTFLGGRSNEWGQGIAVDAAGNAFVVGTTGSPDLPMSPYSLFPLQSGNFDAFLVALAPDGSRPIYSTYLGGSDYDSGIGVAVDEAGGVYVAGDTFSTDFPVQGRVATTPDSDGGGVFLAKVTGLLPPLPGQQNQPPANLTLSNASLSENQPIGSTVGAFLATDPDPGDRLAYTLVSGPGDADNAAFSIDVAGNLLSAVSFNYEQKSSYSIRVRATDWGGLSVEKNFQVTIRDVDEWETPGVYAPSGSVFFLRNDQSAGDAEHVFTYGVAAKGWVPLVGDWNGDGIDTPAMYDPATSTFYVSNRQGAGPADILFNYGVGGRGWLPLVGDWDGDGRDSVGLYDPASSVFFLKNRLESGNADETVQIGIGGMGWLPLVGDWDGKPGDGLGLYDPKSGLFYLKDDHNSGPCQRTLWFGPRDSNWLPLAGNWDGRPGDGIGLYSPDTAQFFLKNVPADGVADVDFVYGVGGQGWQPLVGHWGATSEPPPGPWDGGHLAQAATLSSSATTDALPTLAAAPSAQVSNPVGQVSNLPSVAGLEPALSPLPATSLTQRQPSTAVDQLDLASLADEQLGNGLAGAVDGLFPPLGPWAALARRARPS